MRQKNTTAMDLTLNRGFVKFLNVMIVLYGSTAIYLMHSVGFIEEMYCKYLQGVL